MQYDFAKYCDNYVIFQYCLSANSNCNFCYAVIIPLQETFGFFVLPYIYLMNSFKKCKFHMINLLSLTRNCFHKISNYNTHCMIY